MLPATMTVPAIMSSSADVVGSFGGLIVLVVALSLGVGFVTFIISKARAAKRG